MFGISDEMKSYLLFACVPGIFVLQWFLFAMFRRESVKRDLYENGCRPRHIRWTVWALWAPYRDSMPFRVTYFDPYGVVHKAKCYVTHDWFGPAFGPRVVKWVKDEIISQPLSSDVWVDDEIIRPKLQPGDTPTQDADKRANYNLSGSPSNCATRASRRPAAPPSNTR